MCRAGIRMYHIAIFHRRSLAFSIYIAISEFVKWVWQILQYHHNIVHLEKVIFKLILMMDGQGIFCEIAFRWMPSDLTDDIQH